MRDHSRFLDEAGVAEEVGEGKVGQSALHRAEDFAGAMMALAALRAPVDAFFEAVMVNAPEPAIRVNRLKLLATLRAATLSVADFSKIAG